MSAVACTVRFGVDLSGEPASMRLWTALMDRLATGPLRQGVRHVMVWSNDCNTLVICGPSYPTGSEHAHGCVVCVEINAHDVRFVDQLRFVSKL